MPLTPSFSAKRKQVKKWLVELKRIFLYFSTAKEKGQSLQSRVIWHRRRGKRMVTKCPCSARYSEPHSSKPLTLCAGTGWKSHHSEENGYCGIQAEHLQKAKSNSFHAPYNYLVELTVRGNWKGWHEFKKYSAFVEDGFIISCKIWWSGCKLWLSKPPQWYWLLKAGRV